MTIQITRTLIITHMNMNDVGQYIRHSLYTNLDTIFQCSQSRDPGIEEVQSRNPGIRKMLRD